MNLYRLLYFIFFITALHLHSEEGEASFDVIVSFTGTVSVTISAADVNKVFTVAELSQYDDAHKNVLIGSFNIIVTVTTIEPFTLSSYSDPAYVDVDNQFQALSTTSGIRPAKVFYFGDKNKDGQVATTEMFNDSVIIENYSSTIPQNLSLTVDIYMFSRQLMQKIGHTSFMPIKFNLAGV